MDIETKYIPSKVKAINEDGSVKFRLTEKSIDRHGEVVMPKGGKLQNYIKNPVVLFGHGFEKQGMMPVGRIDPESIEQTADYIDANVIFDDEGTDDFAMLVADKVRNGFLNAGSIGFRAIETSKEPVLDGQVGLTHKKWELMEFSIVPIPALPSATARREFNDFVVKCSENGIDFDENYVKQVERYIALVEETKAGRVLSAKNRGKIKKAIDSMNQSLTALGELLELTEPEKSKELETETTVPVEENLNVDKFLSDFIMMNLELHASKLSKK